jgi:hypothetical protein
VIGKPVALIQVPNQRVFGPQAAAKYLGICEDTLKKYTDVGLIAARDMCGRHAYLLEELERFVESLPKWGENGAGENPLPFPKRKKGA